MKLLITGAGRGLGFYLVKQAVANGHTVFAAVRNPDGLPEAMGRLKQEKPERIRVVAMDVRDESSVSEAAHVVRKHTDAMDVIINNAAILAGREKTIEEVDLEEIRETFEVNTFGPIRVIKHFLPFVRKGEKPAILNISSEAGSFSNAYGGDYPYALSKSALNMLSQQLHNDLKKRDILVAAIHPGWMRTDMGGPKAHLHPEEAAEGILRMAERKMTLDSEYAFVDHLGRPMPI